MSKLRAMNCTNCGGLIDKETLICKMCGTAYMLDEYNMPIKFEVSHVQLETLSGKVVLPRELLYEGNEENFTEITLREMAKRMADKLLPMIEYQMEFDPYLNEYVTYGRLRVANPYRSRGV